MEQAIDNLVALGNRLKTEGITDEMIAKAAGKNPWFVESFIRYALKALEEEMLSKRKLNEWLGRYQLKPVNKRVGLIFAGNVPLTGFHDFLCCYVAGCSMKIKLSSKDDTLFPGILNLLAEIDPAVNKLVEIVERLKDFDAVIATGSNNTNRYFEYYFRKYPKILRKNRNAVAILTGEETPDELRGLAGDIFTYFGFGCRNVSKIYVPQGYDVRQLYPHFDTYKWMHGHTRYMNNYDYNCTLLLLNKTPFTSNEIVMLAENTSIPSPIATVHYEFWHDENLLHDNLHRQAEKIQCIVSSNPQKWNLAGSAKMGQAQHPQLWDYADGVDTMEFLLRL
jgi:hypothetical protein